MIPVLILCTLLFVVSSAILITSPGKLPTLKDRQGRKIAGSLSEKTWVDINGLQQGMFIRSEDPTNPVVLYIHGGPGTPMLQFISYLEKDVRLEKYFTVCYWDQRGSGMTYSHSADPATMTVENMVEDAHQVTEYLKSRFGQKKIYVIGHSWGSYLSVKLIEKYPEDYLAYISLGQTVNFVESERLSYHYMLKHAKEINDLDVLDKLEQFDPSAVGFPLLPEEGHQLDYMLVRTTSLNKYGIGHIHDMKEVQEGSYTRAFIRAMIPFKGYTVREKINWFLGADYSMVYLFPVLLDVNLMETSVDFEIPIYMIVGDYDYMTSQVLAQEYFSVLKAPKKEYFAFHQSAHSANMEEPELFIEVMRKVAAENPQ